MLDLLHKVVIGETLDSYFETILDTDGTVEEFSKTLPASSSSMAPIMTSLT